ncbi:hypothetical protein ACIQ6Y_00105 [Streptomyces sp. NPDC096205]|uniref:hypothetical protein n=1 Tax=Streptomyces sp. NPDC096205 TaxID=3366081 RepID=UPI00382E5E98
MASHLANGDSRLSFWLRVREYAVPPSMVETATARRRAGDWAGACAAAGIDVDLAPRSVALSHGREAAAQLRDDLRHLAPDLLRWHMPRIAPDGLLRPALTVSLARYEGAGRDGVSPLHLVVRTPPARADAGQRMSLALWDASRPGTGAGSHPHARPSRRFRLDLHRHLWDVRRTRELRTRSGADRPPPFAPSARDAPPRPPDSLTDDGRCAASWWAALPDSLTDAGRCATETWSALPGPGRCAVDLWAAEARLLLRADGSAADGVVVRLDARHRLLLTPVGDGTGPPEVEVTRVSAGGRVAALPVLPDAATWVLPDLELLRAGLAEPGLLHPLVAESLVPGHTPGPARAVEPPGAPHVVECRGRQHRIGLVDGVLAPLDHEPGEVRREELLAALSGPPLPCLRAIDEAHRRPDCLTGVRERLLHGDIAGALAVVEGLLGPGAVLRSGPLLDELEAAAQRRIAYGLFRADLADPVPRRTLLPGPTRPRAHRYRPRHTTAR